MATGYRQTTATCGWKGQGRFSWSLQNTGPQNQEGVRACCCKPPGWWELVTAVLGNQEVFSLVPRRCRPQGQYTGLPLFGRRDEGAH